MAIIHRIGTPENDSEARAIKRLGKDLSDYYFVFHNFELTTGRGFPYECDIAVLSPHALYHLEVKGHVRASERQQSADCPAAVSLARTCANAPKVIAKQARRSYRVAARCVACCRDQPQTAHNHPITKGQRQ
jgi:hypothetical protein